MLAIFTLFSRFFWVFLLLITWLNARVLQRRFDQDSAMHPERASGYRQVLRGFLVISLLLWGWMGVGILLGAVPDVLAYLLPIADNPFVVAWHGMVILLWLAGAFWVFVGGGAQFVVDHPQMLRNPFKRRWVVKLWFLIFVLGGLFGELVLWSVGTME